MRFTSGLIQSRTAPNAILEAFREYAAPETFGPVTPAIVSNVLDHLNGRRADYAGAPIIRPALAAASDAERAVARRVLTRLLWAAEHPQMTTYTFTVQIETDTLAHATQVIGERIGFDEELEDSTGYRFDYWIGGGELVGANVRGVL
ncbi:hypothetical protein [Leifsonia shinshuensis]